MTKIQVHFFDYFAIGHEIDQICLRYCVAYSELVFELLLVLFNLSDDNVILTWVSSMKMDFGPVKTCFWAKNVRPD